MPKHVSRMHVMGKPGRYKLETARVESGEKLKHVSTAKF